MPTLIACLSTGKGTWNEVNRLIQVGSWNKVFLITNPFGAENFRNKLENTELIVVDADNKSVVELVDDIKKNLDGKIADFEVALNFVSGSGKEHMAILEVVLELGLNFRIVAVNSRGEMDVLGLRG